MNKNNIFVDTNILIGYYAKKVDDVRCIKHLFSLSGKRLYVSSLSIAQLVSVFQKKKTNNKIKEIVEHILSKYNVISFETSDIRESLKIDNSDMEDSIQYAISKKYNCYYFVTNNTKDYKTLGNIFPLPAKKIHVIKKD